MSKILIEGNKVIIDGHANDLDTCNTLTNLCDELSTSEKFRTIKYESGYGEFESVSENKEKKFAVTNPAIKFSVIIYSNDGITTLYSDYIVSKTSIEVTSTGLVGDGNQIYTYAGSKLFAGLTTSANATAPKYKPGDTIKITGETTLYIVENIIIPEHHNSLNELFTNIAAVIREKTGDEETIPAVEFPNLIRERLEASPPKPYLTFKSPSSFTLKVNDATKHWDGTLEYSTDVSTWSTWDGTTTLSSGISGSKDVLHLRGTGNTVITGNSINYGWVLTGTDIKCIGNIENLLDYATVESGAHPTMANNCYQSLFDGCKFLIQAPALPATTLTDYCYAMMFRRCESLTQAPALPATTLTDNCYWYMFQDCTGLTQAPALPATTLANSCYYYMFKGCTGLVQAPTLPATTLSPSCYYYMFKDCTGLTQAPDLPATTLASWCYRYMFYGCTGLTRAPALPATTLSSHCYDAMFFGCTGLTQAPDLPATTLAESCYDGMFYGCTSLVQAPALPATTLANSCYHSMFNRCTNLTQASSLPATTLAESCYKFMFEFTAITAIPRITATTYATDSCKGMFDDIKTLNVYSSSGPGHTYGWTAPASTYCSGMFGSDDGESEWAKLDGSNFPNSGTPTEGVTYYFATVVG